MADTSGMYEIRGIDVDKAAKGFADEEIILKRYVTVTPTSAREIRWYQKTSGFLGGTTTSGITADLIDNTAPLALPTVVEQSWTRNTSYVRKYFVESPTISEEDIRDSDIDVLSTNIRDLTRAVQRRVEVRIFNVLTESQSVSNINSVTTTSVGGDQWDAASGQDPIKDIMRAKRLIRESGYNPEGGILMLDSQGHEALLSWLISDKGASVPQFASQKLVEGVVMEILGLRVIVSEAVVSDYGVVFVPEKSCTYKVFTNITAREIVDEGIGVKVRVWEEGEALLTDPKSVTLIIDLFT